MQSRKVNLVLLLVGICHQYVYGTDVGIVTISQHKTPYFDNFTRAFTKRNSSADPKVSLPIYFISYLLGRLKKSDHNFFR